MPLEKNITEHFSGRIRSWVAGATVGAYLLAAPFLSSCSTTEVGRKPLGSEWIKSNKPEQVEVISSTTTYEEKTAHQLEDRVRIDYDTNRIIVSVNKQTTKHPTRIDTIRYGHLFDENWKEEVLYRGTNEKKCKAGTFIGGSVGLGIGLIVGLIAGVASSPSEEEQEAKGISDGDEGGRSIGVTFGTAAGMTVLGTAIGALIECQQREWTEMEVHSTNIQKKEYSTEINRVKGNPEVLKAVPLSQGSLTAHAVGLIPESTYLISGGSVRIDVPTPAYPLLFTNTRETIRNMVDISWIKPPCQDGVLDYITEHSEETSTSLKVHTRPPENVKEPYVTDEKTYPISLLKAPSWRDVMKYVVNKQINRRIQQATVVYKDLDSHAPLNNMQGSFTPVRVPYPADLARQCFDAKEDHESAVQFIDAYRYAPFDTRINGEHSFMVYVPSMFRVKVIHPDYHYRDERLEFTEGGLEKERFMTLLGSKHRVKTVPE